MISCCTPKSLKFFKAASDKHRQRILALLKVRKSLNASEIRAHIKLSQPTVSHHLALLTEAELLHATKKGKETYYELNNKSITACCLGFMNALIG
jgi:DNA-binding transcriptional ArsR family regulator